MKQIILEGPDLGGKTTISKFVTNITGIKIHHTGGPPKDLEDFLKKFDDIPENCVFDRYPMISDFIYSKLPGRPVFVTMEMMIEKLKEVNPIILFCRPTDNHLYSALDYLKVKPHKGPEHVENVRANYWTIVKYYDFLMSNLKSQGFNVVKVDFNTLTEEKLEKILNEY